MKPHPLDGLDEIDWSSMSHAYGQADDVPGLLRRYWEGTDADRDEVLGELHGNIWHQFTVYEATPDATRFLVAMVGEQSCPKASGLLYLLSAIAQGMNYVDQHATSPQFRLSSGDTDMERDRQNGRAHVADSRAAVAKGLSVYRQYLESDDLDAAAAAANLLVWFVRDDPAIAERLIERLETAPTELAVEVARVCLHFATDDLADSNYASKVASVLRDNEGADNLDIYRTAFDYLSSGDAAVAVESFIDQVGPVSGDNYHDNIEVAAKAFGQGSTGLVDFAIGVFRSDPSLMATYLMDAATESDAAAALVCEQVAELIEDRSHPLSIKAVTQALDVLASAGSDGIATLERLAETVGGIGVDGAGVDRALALAKNRHHQSEDVSLWWEGPDPSWTAAECIEMIESRLTIRQQDQDVRLRATMRLIELGPAAAPADIALQIAELASDRAQISAANLLWSANRDAAPVVAILEQQFGGGDLLRTADLARRMGAAAAPLLPRFRELLAQDRMLSGGIVGEITFAEQATRTAIEAAVAAIESS